MLGRLLHVEFDRSRGSRSVTVPLWDNNVHRASRQGLGFENVLVVAMKDAALTPCVRMGGGTSGETHVVSLRGSSEAKADTRGVGSGKQLC